MSKVDQTLNIIVHFSGPKPTLGSFPAVESMASCPELSSQGHSTDSQAICFFQGNTWNKNTFAPPPLQRILPSHVQISLHVIFAT